MTEWQQFEVKTSIGAEPWLIVRHRKGWFRLPAYASASELLRGVVEGWRDNNSHSCEEVGTVRVRADVLALLEIDARAERIRREHGSSPFEGS